VIAAFEEIARACDLHVPDAWRRPIAHVGTGTIVEVAHAPAYRKAGLPVVGAFDLDPERARAFAARWQLQRVYTSIDELLADPSVKVVDVAVPPWEQPAIVRSALLAGKDVLAQKPFALDSTIAAELAELAQTHSRHLVINQQMRYDEGIAAARAMIERGWIGKPSALEMSVDIFIDWRNWFAEADELVIWYHAIHELDAIRSLLGTPSRVWCSGSTFPGTPGHGERRVMCGLRFTDGAMVTLHVSTENRSGDPSGTFRIDGTEGTIRGELRRFYKGERNGPDVLELYSRVLPTDGWARYDCTRTWFPDAFVGPMRALLRATAEGISAPTGARDNVKTVRLVEALYRAIETGEAQSLT
jgi:predicted dehydrogenase